MKILFLAPQPFFQERGTPIAVRLALEALSRRHAAARGAEDRETDSIDLLIYHEGSDVQIPGVNIFRIKPGFLSGFLRGVSPGVSLKKMICDVLFLFEALRLVIRSRKTVPYKVVHAVEESVFIALLIKFFFKIPYIYDMDSSLAMQVTEKWWILRPLYPVLRWFERLAVKHSMAVAPVCDSLGVIARKHGAAHTFILRDISLIDIADPASRPSLHDELGIDRARKIVLYVGNLETYQGIDLLFESYALVCSEDASSVLVIIGGNAAHIEYYRGRAAALGIGSRVYLAGPRPVERLGDYVLQADILVSPRIKGNNTPMKIYSYLHAGRALLATDMPTHTQVLDSGISELAAPDKVSFSRGMVRLLADPELRRRLGEQAQKTAEELYTADSFSTELNRLYDQIVTLVTEAVKRPCLKTDYSHK